MTISEKLKEARESSGLTQEQVAEKIKITRQTLSNWETGKTLPDIVSIMDLSYLYNITIDELLKGDKKLREKIKKDSKKANANEKVILVSAVLVLLAVGIFSISKYVGGSFFTFCKSALPWVLYGIGLAFAITYLANKQDK